MLNRCCLGLARLALPSVHGRLRSGQLKVCAPACLLAALALAALPGCAVNVRYIVQQGLGELTVLSRSEPIDDVLAAGRLEAEQERKLRLLVAARDFADFELGLDVGGSYSLFHDTHGEPVAYNLSASLQDSLTPYIWRFPLIGAIEYTGYFSRIDAEEEAQKLQQAGYDTFIYGVDAFSTLGYLPDPVHSAFLTRSDGNLVETVIHELAHNTVYAAGQSTFNESLATFIGRQGARLFFEQRGAEGAEILAALERSYADGALITAWLRRTIKELEVFYARDIPRDRKIAGRAAVFAAARARFTAEVQPQLQDPQRYAGWANLPTNNAYILLNRRYNYDLELFQRVYTQAADFRAFLAALQAAAETTDPFAHLRGLAP